MKASDPIPLSERITRWRESQALTKAELARRVGVSPEAVTQWERADEEKSTTPTTDNIEKIATAIGVTLSVFWGEPPAKRRRAS